MDSELIRIFSPHTREEERLRNGAPLEKETYTQRESFVVEGARFVPSRQMISLRPHTRFTAFPMHRHDYVEIMYMLSGSTRHQMQDGAKITLSAGELLLLNRHSAHAIERSGESDIAVNFIIQPAFFDFVPEMIGANNALGGFLLDALRNNEKDVSYLHFKIAEQMMMQRLLESIVYSLIDPTRSSLRTRRTEMGLLFLHLLEHPECMAMPLTAHQENRMVVELLQEIRDHYASFVLKDFAARLHVSSAYLSRVTKEATGRTCTELLQRERIRAAKRYLRDTDLSVMEICAAVGYNNGSYFYRLFKEETGCLPQAMRVNSGHGQT